MKLTLSDLLFTSAPWRIHSLTSSILPAATALRNLSSENISQCYGINFNTIFTQKCLCSLKKLASTLRSPDKMANLERLSKPVGPFWIWKGPIPKCTVKRHNVCKLSRPISCGSKLFGFVCLFFYHVLSNVFCIF